MERELRAIKNKGHFPIHTSTPQGTKIENPQQAKRVLQAVEEEIIAITIRIRESERAYEKGQEALRKQTRTNYNFLGMNSSTPIKTAVQQQTNNNPQTGPPTSIQIPYTSTTVRLNQPAIPIGTSPQQMTQ